MKIQGSVSSSLPENCPTSTDKILYLIDGHAVVYRYYYAFKESPLVTSSGQDTGATFGMAKIVATLLLNYPMTHIGVIFDPACRTWRKDFYPAYKANRKNVDDISPQLEMTFHMLKTWGIFCAAYKLEADDVIAILTKEAEKQGFSVVIVSKDKDFMCLVRGNTRLLDLGKHIGKDAATYIGPEGVYKRFGVRPDQMTDYLTMIGDTSDNVPGITGIGKKTAPELLKKYGNLDGVYKNLEKLTKSQKEKFLKARGTVDRDKKLITLATEYRVPVTLDHLQRPAAVHNADLLELFESLEFFSIIKMFAD